MLHLASGSPMLLVLLVLAGGGLRADERSTRPKQASSPEAAVQLYHQAIRAGELEASLAHVSGRMRRVWEATVGMVRAAQALEDALDRQFGKDSSQQRMFDMKEEARSLKRVEVREKRSGAHGVVLIVWKTRRGANGKDQVSEETLSAVKEETGWKLDLPLPFNANRARQAVRTGADGREVRVTILERSIEHPTDEQIARVAEMMAAGTGVLHALAREIAAGKYPGRREALAALRARMNR